MQCPHCGSLIDLADEDLIVPNHYWAVLQKMSSEVPSQAHCDRWLDDNGYTDEQALRVARAMDNALWFDAARGAWYTLTADGTLGKKEKRKYYKSIILTFYGWMGREPRQGGSNGQRSESSMITKKGGNY